jgi:glycopeptide antibiotics resistance protein
LRPNSSRRAATTLAIYLVFMLTITLLIFHEKKPPVNLRPFASIRRDWARGGTGFVVNLLGNVVAFLPIGMLLPIARRALAKTTAWRALSFGAAFSLLIELAQYLSGRRTCDVDDVILNTLGTLLGFALFTAARSRAPTDA